MDPVTVAKVIDAGALPADPSSAADPAAPATPPPAPPAPPLDPKVVAREMLAEMQRSQPAPEGESAMEREIQRMVASGVKLEAVQNLVSILSAHAVDNERKSKKESAEMTARQFQRTLWDNAESAVNEYDGKVPGLKYACAGLVSQVSDLIEKDPDFKAARDQIAAGRIPDKRWMDKAAEKAIDDYLKETGQVRQKQPVTVHNSKPTPHASEKKGDFFEGLDSDERKMYLAVKNANDGDSKKAQAAVENLRVVLKG